MDKALILGVTGQDGSYLADILLAKGYEVHGLIRKSATGNTSNIRHLIIRLIRSDRWVQAFVLQAHDDPDYNQLRYPGIWLRLLLFL